MSSPIQRRAILPPPLTEAAVLLAVRIVKTPMTAAVVLLGLTEEVSTRSSSLRAQAHLVDAVRHLGDGNEAAARHGVALAREARLEAPRAHGNMGSARVLPALRGPATRPYMGYDPSTQIVWGCGANMPEAQAHAGWALCEAQTPELFAHLRWMPCSLEMLAAVAEFGGDVPWIIGAAGLAIPAAGWEGGIIPLPHAGHVPIRAVHHA